MITAKVVGRYLAGTRRPPEVPSFRMIAQGYSVPTRSAEPREAFHALFTDRFRRLHHLLRSRSELKNIVPVSSVAGHVGEEVSLIGMVKEVRSTKNRHLLLTLDDPSGETTVLVPADSPQSKEPFLPDEVVGLRLWVSKEEGKFARVKEVVRPGLSGGRTSGRSAKPSRTVFISDLHVGSKMFLHDSWDQLTAFLRGESVNPELAQEVRHVVIAGDLVDGIGIYPNQEKDLEITDIIEQYREFGRRMREIPSTVQIVAIPGNHDAVCPAEPQPPLANELLKLLPPNLEVVGNPSTFALDGVVVEAYHGRGFDDIIPNIPSARYERPTEVMKRMLAMRHLSPIFGDKIPLAPLARDGLVVDPVPDVLVTGHTHTSGEEVYRGVLLLNASAWIGETEYQRMRNVKPDPAQAYVVDLTNLGVTKLDFFGGPPKGAR